MAMEIIKPTIRKYQTHTSSNYPKKPTRNDIPFDRHEIEDCDKRG